MAPGPSGRLFCGDNLAVLRDALAGASVDLVYLDPPFNSKRSYTASFRDPRRAASATKAPAFDDSWRWDERAGAAFARLAGAPRVGAFLAAMHGLLGEGELLAYLVMMAERLVELRRVMKPSASIYLHCDPTASHYLKLLCDALFGAASFRNEIVWRYRRWPAKSRQFQKMHDVLLFYGSDQRTFHVLYGYERLAESTLKTFGTRKQLADFSSGHRKPSVEEAESLGPPLSDVWEVGVLAPISRERVGYPTQKPEALLERVILASSSPGDVVLDPFCGSGTALVAAQRHGRRWIGIDESALAIGLCRRRLDAAFGEEGLIYEVAGEPAVAMLHPAEPR